eukprot:scaffold310_cov335-Pavlova_lutheri.AAC.81
MFPLGCVDEFLPCPLEQRVAFMVPIGTKWESSPRIDGMVGALTPPRALIREETMGTRPSTDGTNHPIQ